MHDLSELGIIKWSIEHIAIPLLGGLWGALAWWVQLIAARFAKLEEKQAEHAKTVSEKLSTMERDHADTYARRDDVRELVARIDGKLDVLLKHALKDSQG